MTIKEIDEELDALYDRLNYDDGEEAYFSCLKAIERLNDMKLKILAADREQFDSETDRIKVEEAAKTEKMSVWAKIGLGALGAAAGMTVAVIAVNGENSRAVTSKASQLAQPFLRLL